MLSGKAQRDAEFTSFVSAAMPELSRIAWFLTGEVHGANELVQAALVKTYVAWTTVRPGEEIAFTRRVMVNHRTDQWRRSRREVLSGEPRDTAVERSPVDETDVIDGLVRALRTLPDRQRRVVVLRYYCDLSEKQVAEEMRMSLSAVKSAASRGLSALREHVTELEEWAR
ncbi:SigE family RNA polymerase sigma factor [Serinicoccus kebangsaanensis]|uniref:SigE family RNA polymerase sigma factor n=1 Tax=Serinicoccus kebangsaanensis TaxID=2602069 RepID=UPI001EE2E180|nr:SigE family RNA polymerase sigma factor [Serinicoccus kebangsaanensis]